MRNPFISPSPFSSAWKRDSPEPERGESEPPEPQREDSPARASPPPPRGGGEYPSRSEPERGRADSAPRSEPGESQGESEPPESGRERTESAPQSGPGEFPASPEAGSALIRLRERLDPRSESEPPPESAAPPESTPPPERGEPQSEPEPPEPEPEAERAEPHGEGPERERTESAPPPESAQAPESTPPPQSESEPQRESEPPEPKSGVRFGLPAKLLLLTVAFVMLAEAVIFVPSAARFRNEWLQRHLDMAEAASIVYLDSSDRTLSEAASEGLLRSTGSLAVIIRERRMATLMAGESLPESIAAHIDLGERDSWGALRHAFSLLAFSEPQTYRVFAPMKARRGVVELVQRDEGLRNALLAYSRNILLLSLAISLIAAALVFLSLYRMIVRPIRRISRNMTLFSAKPDDPGLIFESSDRADEIGIAERGLAAFERDLHNILRQRLRLAELGLAVSEINHDLRNILASAQLLADRLSRLSDPTVRRLAPKLLRSIDRAEEYARSVLDYGRPAERQLDLRRVGLSALVEEVGEMLALDQPGDVEWSNRVPESIEVEVDPESAFRVILNLCRNAVQAMRSDSFPSSGAVSRLSVSAEPLEGKAIMRIADTGPGIPEEMRESLFQPFSASRASGGSGLGLAIADELARANRGSISLESTGASGTAFRVELPLADASE